MIARVVLGLALFAAALAGAYLKGRSDGHALAAADYQDDRAQWQQKFDMQKADAEARIGHLLAQHQEAERATQADLDAARAAMADFPRRLQQALEAGARRCAVRRDPAPDGTGRPAPEGAGHLAELVRRLDEARLASLDDAAALTECQAKYAAAVRATAGR